MTQNEEESKFDETDGTKVVKEGIYIRVSDDKQVHDRQIVLMANYQKGRRANHHTEGSCAIFADMVACSSYFVGNTNVLCEWMS